MNKLNLILLTIMLIVLPAALQSCDDDGYSLNDSVVGLATVRVTGDSPYHLELDNGRTLWPLATLIPGYRPLDGQRVVADFTFLYDNYPSGYDHGIRVNYLYNVLTKQVEKLTEANEEEFGNDRILIHDWWIGSSYLNVEFWMYLPNTKKHRVSLVENTTIADPEDGYIHLEFRYNDQDDVNTNYERLGIVSFNLGEFAPEVASRDYLGIKIKYNDRKEGEKVATYTFSTDSNEEEVTRTDLNNFSTEGKIE